MHNRVLAALLTSGCAAAALQAPAACAQDGAHDYDIAAQPLAKALRQYSAASGREVIADASLIAGYQSTRVRGRMSAVAALSRLLSGTSLTVELVDGAFVIRAGNADARGSTDPGIEAIVVTGTRIRGAGPAGSPLLTIDRADIERSGMGAVQQLLQALPQNFGGGQNEATLGAGTRNGAASNGNYGSSVNLRGLGASSTLVLIDGSRPALGGLGGVFADLSLIPLGAVERIEVLTDGASAIYGADAVAGVVNLRLRNRFKGAETTVRFGTADGDMGERQLGQLIGHRWARGGFALAYQLSDRNRLRAASRDFVTEDLRRFGGPDYRSTYAVPGTIFAANGQSFAIPAGQDGRTLDASQLVAGTINRRDARAATDIVPRQRTHSLYAHGDVALGAGLRFEASLLAARRDYEKVTLPETSVAFSVPVTNPFYVDPIGTNRPVSVRYSFVNDLGPEIDRGRVEGLSASAGLEQAIGRWRIQLGGSAGRQQERRRDLNVPNRFRIAQALADTDPATALNLFGDGRGNNTATIERIRGSRRATTRFDSRAAALRADGPLFGLAGGDARLAIGAEYRREHYRARSVTDITTATPVENPNSELPGPRHVRSAYAELLLPLFGDVNAVPGIRRLDISLAGRIEDYSDVGSTTNPKLGLRWEPIEGLALRASYGTSFRAPSFEELIGPSVSLYLATRVPDPQAPGGQANVIALFGYAPDIKPERATTWTAGFDLTPSAIPGLRASLTYYDVDYRDRIGTVTEDYLNFLSRRSVFAGVIDENPTPDRVAFYFGQPTFSNPLGFAPGDIDAILDGQIRNLSSVRQTGLDFDVGYERGFAGGIADIGLAGSHIFRIDREIAAGAPAIDTAGTFASPSKWRLRGRAGWRQDGFSVAGHLNYISGYRNQIPAIAERVAAWTTFDLRIAQRVGSEDARHLLLALSALNFFDKRPPFVNNRTISSALGYDPEKADAAGRMLAIQATMRW